MTVAASCPFSTEQIFLDSEAQCTMLVGDSSNKGMTTKTKGHGDGFS
jgi:hypothetical protein